MGRNKDLSNFDKGQIVMAGHLGQSIWNSKACWFLLVSSGMNLPAPTMGTWTS